jgi:hypothetical protein
MPDNHEIEVGPPVVFFGGENTNFHTITSLTSNTLVVAYNKQLDNSGAIRFGYKMPYSDKIHLFDEVEFSNEAIKFPQVIR